MVLILLDLLEVGKKCWLATWTVPALLTRQLMWRAAREKRGLGTDQPKLVSRLKPEFV